MGAWCNVLGSGPAQVLGFRSKAEEQGEKQRERRNRSLCLVFFFFSLCLSFQTEETLTFLGFNYLIILTPWVVASPQQSVCQGHCTGCFEASREVTDERQVLTAREMLSGGPEPAEGGKGGGREKKEMLGMLGRDCLERGVIEVAELGV